MNLLVGSYVPVWAVLLAAAGVFLMLLAIVVLSICLCRVYKRMNKLKLSRNLPVSSRGQCDGGTNPDAQNSDYATVAVLKEDACEEDFGSHQQTEDSGVEDGVRDEQVFVELESTPCDLE
ncbi:hypothetical protein L345_14813, partial [Ophiophagus hannah]